MLLNRRPAHLLRAVPISICSGPHVDSIWMVSLFCLSCFGCGGFLTFSPTHSFLAFVLASILKSGKMFKLIYHVGWALMIINLGLFAIHLPLTAIFSDTCDYMDAVHSFFCSLSELAAYPLAAWLLSDREGSKIQNDDPNDREIRCFEGMPCKHVALVCTKYVNSSQCKNPGSF